MSISIKKSTHEFCFRLKSILLIFLFQLFFIGYLSAQESDCVYLYPTQIFEDWWGKGVYHIANKGQKIPFYNESLESKGCFEKRINNMFFISFDRNEQGIIKGKGLNGIYLGYKLNLLPVKEHPTNDEFINISWSESIGKYYVKKKDLADIGGQYLSYWQILVSDELPELFQVQIKGRWLGINLKRNCLNLRSEASFDSKILDCVPGNDWGNSDVTKVNILDVSNQWARIEVNYLGMIISEEIDDPCQKYFLKEIKIGWVKMIDSEGFPNIWYAQH